MKTITLSLFVTLLFLLTSCAIFKRTDIKEIKGNYSIIKVEKTDNEKAQIACIVYDKEHNTPISHAVVAIEDLKLGGFTEDNGSYEIETVGGKYIITALNAGNTTIHTKPINFAPYTKTTIKFLLGTTYIYEK